MFLVAGVQPRTRKGRKTDQICPRCGLAQVYEKTIDHYFSLFFIPLIRVKKGTPLSWCERCRTPLSHSEGNMDPQAEMFTRRPTCHACGEPLDPKFRYCPHCGRPTE